MIEAKGQRFAMKLHTLLDTNFEEVSRRKYSEDYEKE